MSAVNPNQIINQLKRIIEADKHSEIRLSANGGNSILIVCDPMEEQQFIDSINNNLDKNKFESIDINKLLIGFVKENKQNLEILFDLLQGSVNQIFKAPPDEESEDFFKKIIQSISEKYADSKIPILINTGVLYGAGIDNINIMEHEVVMNASQPLVVLYPATQEKDSLAFLGKRPASKYRCMIIP